MSIWHEKKQKITNKKYRGEETNPSPGLNTKDMQTK